MAISAVVLTKNEEKNIGECLKTLKWAEEVVVIDDESTDKTVEIAKANGAQVYEHPLDDDFSAQRNFGLDKAKGEWVFFVDADERVSSTLRAEIQLMVNDQPFDSAQGKSSIINGFYLKREDKMWGRVLKHGENAKVKLLRLGKKGKGEWEKPVHEIWEIKGEIGELKAPLQHLPHQTISEFLEEINFYSTLRARELYKEGKRASLLEIIFYTKAKFIKDYFLELGFLDGMPGFVVALLMSFHSFLVRSKLYLLWRQEGGWK